jgi:hypothetical protein
MPPEKPGSSRLEPYTSVVKDGITILAGMGGIGYAAGFLIVNSSLMAWGITDVTLVKARYVSVGFLFMMHVALTLTPASLFTWALVNRACGDEQDELKSEPAAAFGVGVPPTPHSETTSSPLTAASLLETSDSQSTEATKSGTSLLSKVVSFIASQGRARSTALLTLWIVLTFTVMIALSVSLQYLTFNDFWADLGEETYLWNLLRQRKLQLILFWYLPLFVAGVLLPLILIEKESTRKRWLFSFPVRLMLIGGVLLVLLLAIKAYASDIYPRTSPAIGGGDFYLVKLSARGEKARTLAELTAPPEIPRTADQLKQYGEQDYTAKWVFLLDQSDKAYFVLVLPKNCDQNKARAVEVPKDLVEGVIHYNAVLDLSPTCY